MTLATKAEPTMTPAQRQGHNLALALELAAKGYYVFPSNNKVPLCAVWQKADTSFTPAAREAEAVKAFEKNGFMPLHVGSTINAKVIKNLWRKYPDSVPSISCGPSNLFVIDADVNDGADGKRIKAGPAKLSAWLAENTVAMDGVFTVTTRSGGRHLYFKNAELLTSAAGILRDLDCDTRGVGGQTVAPGAIRVDGASYDIMGGMTLADLANTPETPAAIVTAACTQRETTTVTDKEVADRISTLEDATIESFDDLFDPITGYDLNALQEKDAEFAALRAHGTGDISRNRFKIARCLMREWPQMPVEHLLAFHGGWVLEDGTEGAGTFNDGSSKKGSGEYNFRDVSREHAKGLSDHKVPDKARMESALALADDCEDAISTRESFEVNKLMSETLGVAKQATKVPMRRGHLVAESLDQLCEGDEVVSWLVKNYLEVGITGVFFGPPGEGKTAALIDLGLRVSHGIPWHGRKTKRTGVLYVIQEGRAGAKRRVRAWLKWMKDNGHDVGDGAFRMVRASIDLFNSDRDMNKLIKLAKDFPFDFGVECGMVIIDTLAQALKGGNASSDQDIGIVTGRMDYMRDETGAFVAAVHHNGKDAARGPRGSNAIPGNTDVCIAIIDKTFRTDSTGTKLREGDPTQKFPFTLNVVVMGQDEDGDPVTTVVASESRRGLDDVSAEDEGKLDYAPLDGLKERQEMVVEVFDRLIDQPEELRSRGQSMAEVGTALNSKRKKWKLAALKNSSVYDVIKPMVDGGRLLKVGTLQRPRYCLAVEAD